jgi:pimeloyl-ACP methyl ester carboxylesterase
MEKSITTGYAPVNGLNMYYEIHGDGAMPLVIIHGGGSTIETTFSNLLPIFSAYTKVIAVELQAHGRTSDRDAPESFAQDADDVAGLLKCLKINKANFLGFSNGGSTAMQIAIRHPEMANKMVAISACYKKDGLIPGLFDGLQHATLADMPEALKDAYLKVAPDKNQLQVMFNKDKERMLNFKDWPDDDLKSIKAPTLLIAADHDVITVEHTLEMSKLIPGARLVILPGNHGSIIGEAGSVDDSKLYETTAAMVKTFLGAGTI